MAEPKSRRRERGSLAKRGRGGQQCGPIYAAVDLGTNNCRLLIARPVSGGFRVLDAFSRIVRLGEGLAATGDLSEPAISRAVGALGVCAGKMRRQGVGTARCVATDACRRARNCAEFLARVRRETGLALEIISAREEARLALVGCMPLLEPAGGRALVFDIGGGSTELIWLEEEAGPAGTMRRVAGSISLPCGVVSLSERFGGRDLVASAYEAMVAEARAMIAPFARQHAVDGAAAAPSLQMLGTSGTVTTFAALHLGLRRYDRRKVDGCYLSFDDVAAVRARLTTMSYADRVALACIGRGRADLVLAGAAILDAICGTWPAGRLRVADRGLREGILLGLMRPPDEPAALAAAAPA